MNGLFVVRLRRCVWLYVSTTDDVDERIVCRAFETVCLVVVQRMTWINGLLVVRLRRCVWLLM
jgi:hypothetical protein